MRVLKRTLIALTCCAISAMASPLMLVPGLKTQSYPNGATFCAQNYNGYETCIPGFNNTSNVAMTFAVAGYGSMVVQPQNGLALAGNQGVVNQIVFSVTNNATGQKIFQGPVDNLIGIACTATACAAWR